MIPDIGSTGELFLLGEFNDGTGRNINNKIVGPYKDIRLNDDNTQLIDKCKYNNHMIRNGFFKVNRFTSKHGYNRIRI